ncbi:MAG: hypothetical protein WA849_03455 [Candidatus Udaeobacter sp.]
MFSSDDKAAREHEPLHMTEVNYAEVQYIIIRKNGLTGWETVAGRPVALPIGVSSCDAGACRDSRAT